MASSSIIVALFLLMVSHHGISEAKNGDDYVRDACRVTRYPSLCIHSLASFSDSAKRNPRMWARASVSVTIAEAKSVTAYLSRLKTSRYIRGRARLALLDCIESFQDTINELYNSLAELRRLSGKTFNSQIGDVETWVSSALTYEDTCLEGFDGRKGPRVRLLCNRVTNVTYFTSNALALVNKLASSGGGSLSNP
ncbi:pectinesterase inhibitor 6-like [Tasmannia lanceolata]|uniref:pectinesterase inhibitor 6-like n=1 Tax=Tasmannia lanceolata TaxID=3420 RepID=UPI004063C5E4